MIESKSNKRLWKFSNKINKIFLFLILFFLTPLVLSSCSNSKTNNFEKYIKDNYSPAISLKERQKEFIPPAKNGVIEDLFAQQSFYSSLYSVITKLDFKDLGKFALNFGFKEFYKPIVDFITNAPAEEKPKNPEILKLLESVDKIMEKLDAISENQTKLFNELSDLSTMIECQQLNDVLNSFEQLKNNNLAPQTIYQAVRAEENNETITEDERQKRIMSDLLGGMGFGSDYQLYNRTDVAFDNYTYSLGQAILGPYRVTFKNDKSVYSESGNIFWILYELKRREVDWEHLANESRVAFHTDILSQYQMAATIDIQSMNSRIAAIKNYNDTKAPDAPFVSDTNVIQMRDKLLDQIGKISELEKKWEVIEHDYRFFWVPGHEIKIMPYFKAINLAEKHKENKAAGIDDQVALDNPVEYFKEYMTYDETHPLIRGSMLANLYRFVAESGRLKNYGKDGTDFWAYLIAEGGFTVDSKVTHRFALCSPEEFPPSEGLTTEITLLEKYTELQFTGFSPHPMAILLDPMYFDQWETPASYGIRRDNMGLIITYDFDPDGFDNHWIMLIGTVNES